MSDAPVLGPVNHVTDLDAADDFARKHTPFVAVAAGAAGASTVTVEVGHYVPHPNAPDHFIQWIALVVDGAEIARVDLSPVATAPAVSFSVTLDAGTSVRAIAHCNLHGLWAADVTV